MDEITKLSVQQPPLDTTSLTIKIANSGKNIVPSTVNSLTSSPYNSPSLISPPSAFVSALQSPYISPRASLLHTLPSEDPTPTPTPATTLTHPSPPVSYSGSQSDDIPSTSYTPPPERSDYSSSSDPAAAAANNNNTKLKIFTCVPPAASAPETAPRVSFSFPVPRISFAKSSVSVSPASNVKLRSCDVYIGFHGQNSNLVRFCKWLKSELELQGIACFVADRTSYAENQSHEIADRVICSVSFGVVVLTRYSSLNHLTMEEIRFFSQKKNLIPLLFDTDTNEIVSLFSRHSDNKECKQALDGLMKSLEFKLEANAGNWRSCVSKATEILRSKLGRKSAVEKEMEEGGLFEELPFPRNRYFVGREKELLEIESAFFGLGDNLEEGSMLPTSKAGTQGQSDGLADDESEIDKSKGGKFINLEVGNCKEPNLENWVEVVIGRNAQKRSTKYKKSKSGKYKSFGSIVICINGSPGVGKTELALEFAYRHAQRYKMVFWIGGEARHFRQNILNISVRLGLDVSADPEKERGRIRGFDEQETEAFKRVKRELFRDMPYLLIIDNLETAKEWWEGKDLHDLIPSNTGGTHVIITTRLSRVMNFDIMQLQPLPLSDAMMLIRGRQKKEYPAEEIEYLGRFDEKLRRSSFGLCLVGSLLSEMEITPSALFEAVNELPLPMGEEEVSIADHHHQQQQQQFCIANSFLIKLLEFCASVLQQNKGSRNLLSSRMLQVGAWFASAPVSVNLLAAAAKNMPASRNRLKKWSTRFQLTFGCCSGCYMASQARSVEEEAALVLINMGLARKANRQPGFWIQFHPITQIFARGKDGLVAAKATVEGVRKIGDPLVNLDHLWASAFLVFGYKSEPPILQLKAMDMVLFIKRTALPLALQSFLTFSRCNSALELLKVCTNVLDEVEKSFVSQIQDWCHGSFCWKQKLQSNQKVDEYVWKEVTLLKATLLETRATLLLRGGHFDSGEELCRTCISIRTVMLGHNHAQTLAAQKTLAKLVRMRSKI